MTTSLDYENMTNKIRCKKCRTILDGGKKGLQTCKCGSVSVQGVVGNRTIKFPPNTEPVDWVQYIYKPTKK